MPAIQFVSFLSFSPLVTCRQSERVSIIDSSFPFFFPLLAVHLSGHGDVIHLRSSLRLRSCRYVVFALDWIVEKFNKKEKGEKKINYTKGKQQAKPSERAGARVEQHHVENSSCPVICSPVCSRALSSLLMKLISFCYCSGFSSSFPASPRGAQG